MVCLFLFLSSISVVSSIFADEVGKFDFLVSTAGHGKVQSASFVDGNTIITSGSGSCHVSGRNVEDGSLLWRWNSCSTEASSISQNAKDSSDNIFSMTVLKNDVVATLDSMLSLIHI